MKEIHCKNAINDYCQFPSIRKTHTLYSYKSSLFLGSSHSIIWAIYETTFRNTCNTKRDIWLICLWFLFFRQPSAAKESNVKYIKSDGHLMLTWNEEIKRKVKIIIAMDTIRTINTKTLIVINVCTEKHFRLISNI